MRFFVLAFFLLTSISPLFSQPKALNRSFGPFSSVELKGSIDVVIIPAEKYEVMVDAENPLDIITEVIERKLVISSRKGKSVISKELRAIGKKQAVYVYVPTIDQIKSIGSGNIHIEGIIKTDSLYLSIAGSGNLTGQVNSEFLKLRSIGSGNTRLKGTAVTTEINSVGSGNVQCFDLITDDCTISSSGSGNTQITVNRSISARITGTGNANYRGNPVTAESKVSGTGKLKKV